MAIFSASELKRLLELPHKQQQQGMGAISGEWLAPSPFPNLGGEYNQYSTAPNNGATGHILWDTQPYLGGIVGGIWAASATRVQN